MARSKYIRYVLTAFVCAVILTGSNILTDTVSAEPVLQRASISSTAQALTKPLDVVNSPKTYLNKKITMDTKFDKFSTLGLDYKTAMRSSQDYISFLIKRDDTSYDIPLSEMKLFMKRNVAEKFIDLKTNDEIRIVGTVFSDALGDAWVDVESLTIINKAPDKDGVK